MSPRVQEARGDISRKLGLYRCVPLVQSRRCASTVARLRRVVLNTSWSSSTVTCGPRSSSCGHHLSRSRCLYVGTALPPTLSIPYACGGGRDACPATRAMRGASVVGVGVIQVGECYCTIAGCGTGKDNDCALAVRSGSYRSVKSPLRDSLATPRHGQ